MIKTSFVSGRDGDSYPGEANFLSGVKQSRASCLNLQHLKDWRAEDGEKETWPNKFVSQQPSPWWFFLFVLFLF